MAEEKNEHVEMSNRYVYIHVGGTFQSHHHLANYLGIILVNHRTNLHAGNSSSLTVIPKVSPNFIEVP